MTLIDENMAEQACLGWFEDLGYLRVFGPNIAPGGSNQERTSYKQIVLQDRLMGALRRVNPTIPDAILEDAEFGSGIKRRRGDGSSATASEKSQDQVKRPHTSLR